MLTLNACVYILKKFNYVHFCLLHTRELGIIIGFSFLPSKYLKYMNVSQASRLRCQIEYACVAALSYTHEPSSSVIG